MEIVEFKIKPKSYIELTLKCSKAETLANGAYRLLSDALFKLGQLADEYDSKVKTVFELHLDRDYNEDITVIEMHAYLGAKDGKH